MYKLGFDSYLYLEEEKEIIEWKCGFYLKKDDLNTVLNIIKTSNRVTHLKTTDPEKPDLLLKQNPILAGGLLKFLRNIGQEDIMEDPSQIFNG